MDPTLIRRLSLFVLPVILLSGCGSLSEKPNTPFSGEYVSPLAEPVAGFSSFDTISKEDKANDKWWGSFYGTTPAAE